MLLLIMAVSAVMAQSSGIIMQPGSEGPVFDYEVAQGQPKEYYDAGGANKGMYGNLAYTMLQLKPKDANSHITIVFNEMDIDDLDEMRIYNGLVVLNNEPNEDGEYEYGWPKNLTPVFETKGTPSSMPFTVSSKSADGALSVAFYCFSDKPGWKGMIYCVKNGDPEPNGNTQNKVPNIALTVDPSIVLDEDDEDGLMMNLELMGVQENQTIEIDDGYGKTPYSLGSMSPKKLSLEVEPGDVIKIYGELSLLNASSNQISKVELGKNEKLEVLNLLQNKLQTINLTNLPSLRELWLTNNKITSIDLSNLAKLKEFYGSYNEVGELRTTMNKNLNVLSCIGMGLKELDLSQNTALEILKAGNNPYVTIPDVSLNKALFSLDLENAGVTDIDVSMLPKLNNLDLSGNKLVSIDLTQNSLLRTIDLDGNLFDACSMNDVLYRLPQAEAQDDATLRMMGNPGASTCDNTLLEGKNWKVNFAGDGTGCSTVRYCFEPSEKGTIETKVDGQPLPEWTPVEKGKIVSVNATAGSGFSLVKLLLDGKEVKNGAFKAEQYGLLAAVYESSSSAGDVSAGRVSVVKDGTNVLVSGLKAGEVCQAYDVAGKLLVQSPATTEGKFAIPLPQAGLVIIRQGEIVIKVMH